MLFDCTGEGGGGGNCSHDHFLWHHALGDVRPAFHRYFHSFMSFEAAIAVIYLFWGKNPKFCLSCSKKMKVRMVWGPSLTKAGT